MFESLRDDGTAAAKSRPIETPRLVAFGVIGLHVVDDNFLQPEPGVSPLDHLASDLVPLSLLAAAAAAYGRLRAGLRGSLALVFGFFGLLGGSEAAYYLQDAGPSGDDYTGCCRSRRDSCCSASASRRSGARGVETTVRRGATFAGRCSA